MMIISVLFVLLLILIIYLLFVPIIIVIDSVNNQYFVQLRGLAKVSLIKHQQELMTIKLAVFF
jgi:hypothetical protein